MAYGFNNDKSKSDLTNVMTQREVDVDYEEPTGDFFVKLFTSTFTVASGSGIAKTIENVNVNGYKVLGVVGLTGGTQNVTITGCEYGDAGNGYLNLSFRNASSGNSTLGVRVNVLYVSESLLTNGQT